jgi:hypothetical protein
LKAYQFFLTLSASKRIQFSQARKNYNFNLKSKKMTRLKAFVLNNHLANWKQVALITELRALKDNLLETKNVLKKLRK